VKVDLLSRAKAMVFPIDWAEPFGLVMIEAMACGTPVVTCPAGAAVEVVVDGVTGYLRESIDDLVEAVETVDRCDPKVCRQHVADHFAADQMVDAYEQLLREVATSSRA
jgi:glycosyltransferase involved in cell wall biosynthesis